MNVHGNNYERLNAMKYKIITMSGAAGQGTEQEFADKFADKLNEEIVSGWDMVNHQFPNGPNGFRWVALLGRQSHATDYLEGAPDRVEHLEPSKIPKEPKAGDRAYTMYHCSRYEGVLVQDEPGSRIDRLVPADDSDWGFHSDFPGLFVGYSQPIIWDVNTGMWFAPADPD